jgi:hypothetical protein
MTRISHADVKRQHLEIIARLMAMQVDLPSALANLRDAQPGYPTGGSGGGAPTLDAAGNPPGLERYLDKPDEAARNADLILTYTAQMLNSAVIVHGLVTGWADSSTSPHEGGIAPRRVASGGDCVVCATYCSGAHNDRLRAGLCMPCYQDQRRSPLDRGEWMLERRRNLLSERVDDVA